MRSVYLYVMIGRIKLANCRLRGFLFFNNKQCETWMLSIIYSSEATKVLSSFLQSLIIFHYYVFYQSYLHIGTKAVGGELKK